MQRSFHLFLLFILFALGFSALTLSPAQAAPPKLDVVNWGNGSINQSNLDGTSGISLGNLNDTLLSPYGLAISGLATDTPTVSLSTTSLDFGNQQVGTTSASQTVTLTNTGMTDLHLGMLSVTGEFELSNNTCSSATVTPSSNCTFTITFSPTSLGMNAGSVSVPSDAATSPDSLSLSGMGVAISTTTSLSSSQNPSLLGQAITFTATVSPPPDGGTVAFKNRGIIITGCGTQPLIDGQATCTIATLMEQVHPITAVYSGNAGYHPSTSAALYQGNYIHPAIEAGAGRTCKLKADGTLTCWGWNNYGQSNEPTPNANWVQVSADGSYHTCGLKADGTLVCWGWNYRGQTTVPSPNANWVQVSTGDEYSCGLKADGTLVCWGSNLVGQSNVPSPNANWVQVSTGIEHTCGLKADRTLTCWGWNNAGQTNVPSPNANWIQVSTGGYHTCGLKANGTLVCWGSNGIGQTNVPNPNTNWQQVSLGYLHTCGLKADGTLRCWGFNDYGQTTIPNPNENWVQVRSGGIHTCGLKTDGTLRCWGWNGHGEASVITLAPETLPNATLSTAYIQNLIASGGSATPYTYSVLSGTTPPGLTLNPDGTWSGAPTALGTFNFTAQAIDANHIAGTRAYALTVNCPSTVTVTNTADSGAGTLRQALADVCPGGTITFNEDMTILLTSELVVDKDLTIDGASHAITVSGNQVTRVLNVTAGHVTFAHLTIADGHLQLPECGPHLNNWCGGGLILQNSSVVVTVTQSTFVDNQAYYGGGIFNMGTLKVLASTFVNNQAENYGGSLVNEGTLIVQHSTFLGNHAMFGGSLANWGTSTVQASTFANNQAAFGGGIANSWGTLTVQYSTFSGNQADFGGGIYNTNDASLHLTHTLLANTLAGGDCLNQGNIAIIATSDHNLLESIIDEEACALINGVNGNVIGVDPLLSPLGDYGGETQTFALLPGSSALDAGSATCLSPDQRGVSRPQGVACDIGAYESQGFTLTALTGTPQSTVINTAFSTPLGLTVLANEAGEPVDGGLITFTSPTGGASAAIAGSPAPIAGGIVSVTVTANGTAGGPYSVVASANGASNVNFELTNEKGTAIVELSNLTQTYDGTPKAVTVTTIPEGLAVEMTYDGSPIPPTNVGTYAVIATLIDPNYTGSAIGTLTLEPATATVELSNLTQIYDGAPKSVTVTTTPTGLVVSVTYDGSPITPINVGTYAVIATITDPNYTGSAIDTLTITSATATIELSNLTQTYDGTPKSVTVTTMPEGLALEVTYNGSSTAPTNMGTYAVIATITDPNYTGSATDILTVEPATAIVDLSDLTQTYDGTPKSVTVTTIPEGLAVEVLYDGSPIAPTNAGMYEVVATITDPNYVGSVSGTLTVTPASATVELSNLTQTYDGTPKAVTVTTTPAGLAVEVTYDGVPTPPTRIGTYAVVTTVTDPNYTGNVTAALEITGAADLGVTLAGTPSPVLAGASVVYTLTVSNFGPAVVTEVTLTDTLPAEVTLAATSFACTETGGRVTCALGSLAPGTTATVHITGTVALGATSLMTNTAQVGHAAGDPVISNNTASVNTEAVLSLIVFEEDFEEPPLGTEWGCATPMTTTTPLGDRHFLGEYGAETVCLEIAHLPEHTTVKVSFDLFLIRSWDGNQVDMLPSLQAYMLEGGLIGPDQWLFAADGVTLLDTTFSNWVEFRQSYPGAFPSGDYPGMTGTVEVETLGYDFYERPMDAVYHLTLVFEHSDITLLLEFISQQLQSVIDESWGLDNVVVMIHAGAGFGPTTTLYLPIVAK